MKNILFSTLLSLILIGCKKDEIIKPQVIKTELSNGQTVFETRVSNEVYNMALKENSVVIATAVSINGRLTKVIVKGVPINNMSVYDCVNGMRAQCWSEAICGSLYILNARTFELSWVVACSLGGRPNKR